MYVCMYVCMYACMYVRNVCTGRARSQDNPVQDTELDSLFNCLTTFLYTLVSVTVCVGCGHQLTYRVVRTVPTTSRLFLLIVTVLASLPPCISVQYVPSRSHPPCICVQYVPSRSLPFCISVQYVPSRSLPLYISVQYVPSRSLPLCISVQYVPSRSLPPCISVQYVPSSPPTPFQLPQRTFVRAMWTLSVVLSDVVRTELQETAGVFVATWVAQATRYRFQRHVARLEQRLAAVRTLVAAGKLEAWPAAGAYVVSGPAQCDWRQHVLMAQRTCQHLKHILAHRWLSP